MRVIRISWCDKANLSIHFAQDRCLGIRLESLLGAGNGIATLLRNRHRRGSLVIQLHDEDPLIPCLRLDASTMTSTTLVVH